MYQPKYMIHISFFVVIPHCVLNDKLHQCGLMQKQTDELVMGFRHHISTDRPSHGSVSTALLVLPLWAYMLACFPAWALLCPLLPGPKPYSLEVIAAPTFYPESFSIELDAVSAKSSARGPR